MPMAWQLAGCIVIRVRRRRRVCGNVALSRVPTGRAPIKRPTRRPAHRIPTPSAGTQTTLALCRCVPCSIATAAAAALAALVVDDIITILLLRFILKILINCSWYESVRFRFGFTTVVCYITHCYVNFRVCFVLANYSRHVFRRHWNATTRLQDLPIQKGNYDFSIIYYYCWHFYIVPRLRFTFFGFFKIFFSHYRRRFKRFYLKNGRFFCAKFFLTLYSNNKQNFKNIN